MTGLAACLMPTSENLADRGKKRNFFRKFNVLRNEEGNRKKTKRTTTGSEPWRIFRN